MGGRTGGGRGNVHASGRGRVHAGPSCRTWHANRQVVLLLAAPHLDTQGRVEAARFDIEREALKVGERVRVLASEQALQHLGEVVMQVHAIRVRLKEVGLRGQRRCVGDAPVRTRAGTGSDDGNGGTHRGAACLRGLRRHHGTEERRNVL